MKARFPVLGWCLIGPPNVKREEALCRASSMKALVPDVRASSLWPNSLPEAQHKDCHTVSRFQRRNSWKM